MKHRAVVADRPVGRRPRTSRGPGRHLEATFAASGILPPAHMIPASATWKSHHLGREFVAWGATGAAFSVLPTTAYFWQLRTEDRMQTLLTVLLLAVGMWSVLVAHHPRKVLLAGSMLIIQGDRDETFDLADAMQTVELSGDPRKHGWHLVLDRGGTSNLMLNRRDVDPIAVDLIVRHYREVADRRAHQSWARLGLEPTG